MIDPEIACGERVMQEVTDDLLDNPKYFYCERTHCKLKLEICIGRQAANKHGKPFEPIPYAVCVDCQQGAKNRTTSNEGEAIQGKPRRGKGRRHEACDSYGDCLGVAGKRGWKSFNCGSCKRALEFWGVTMAEAEKKVNTRLCGDCGERPTVHLNFPHCSDCLALRKKNKREAQTETPSGGKLKTNSKGRGRPRTRSLGLISKPDLKKEGLKEGKGILTINFGPHAEVLDQVKRLSGEELRPLDLQIIYMLKMALTEWKERERDVRSD